MARELMGQQGTLPEVLDTDTKKLDTTRNIS